MASNTVSLEQLMEYLDNDNKVVCGDGLTFSCVHASMPHAKMMAAMGIPVGASNGIASKPVTFELGFPSAPIPQLKEYAEDWERPTETFYRHVPRATVLQIIAAHGGLSS
jgi:hypothetical protein